MQNKIHISKDFFFQLLTYAETQWPRESVALIFGGISGNSIIARHIELLDNESMNNHTSFSVNPEAQYRLLIEADERGESMVSIFHSHPAYPKPSQSDLKNMRFNPVVWLIASKTTGEWVMKAFILEDENPIEIPIQYSTQPIDGVL